MDARISNFTEASDALTAWRRIANDLAQRFARGDYANGAPLPPAQILAQTYGVNRHTVRQACLHLQELGLIKIRRGSGAVFTSERIPYRLGKRVRLRDNLRDLDLAITGRIVDSTQETCSAASAQDLGLLSGAPVWRIRVVNCAGDLALSTSHHLACATRFPDLPQRLADAGCSFTAAFATYGVADYERRSTQITARAPTDDEALLLGVPVSAPVLATHALDITPDGAPLQTIDAAFRGDRIALRVENE